MVTVALAVFGRRRDGVPSALSPEDTTPRVRPTKLAQSLGSRDGQLAPVVTAISRASLRSLG